MIQINLQAMLTQFAVLLLIAVAAVVLVVLAVRKALRVKRP
jgi:hypothetical protein